MLRMTIIVPMVNDFLDAKPQEMCGELQPVCVRAVVQTSHDRPDIRTAAMRGD